MENLLSKGDKVKTSISDSTLVLKVEGDDALLFTGSQFIVAHGVQKENDKVSWDYGDYYSELPDNAFEKDKKDYGKNFSYETFCEYAKNRMSIITKNSSGEYDIYGDTQPLQEFGVKIEEALRHIYDNNLFEKMDEIIDKSVVYIYPSFKEPKNAYEDELQEIPEDDWELEL